MPELPEVETVRLTVWPELAGRRISQVLIQHPDVVGGADRTAEFVEWLHEATFTGVGRRGKYLILEMRRPDGKGGGQFEVLVHLRMTGKLTCAEPADDQLPHTHLRLCLDDGRELRFADTRRFGRWTLLSGEPGCKAPRGYQELGLEPLGEGFDAPALGARLQGRGGKIKAMLLDQRIVAGIGNIYADEILHRCGLHPEMRAAQLGPDAVARLAATIPAVLSEAVGQGGTTIRDYVDGRGRKGDFVYSLRVYGRAGEPCLACGHAVAKATIAGRSTFFCPVCQPAGRGG